MINEERCARRLLWEYQHNVLLDDRAGLESAYNNLKYVLDHASIESNKTRE